MSPLLPGAAELAYIDVDDTMRQTYGYHKQGAGRGYTGVKGLNALIATLSTNGSRPVITATRLRKESTSSAKGAHRQQVLDHRPAGPRGPAGDRGYRGHRLDDDQVHRRRVR